MKVDVDLVLQRIYPYPIEAVWNALTDRGALAEWLMPSDFEALLGRSFTFRTDPGCEGRGWNACRVLEMDPPRRMVWAWESVELDEPTKVVFELEEVEGGTRLTLRHTGATTPRDAENVRGGWPPKLDGLERFLMAQLRRG
jgi:uncharacterized protein YndB with AHSA1/START domain